MEEIYGIWSASDCLSPMIFAPLDYPSPAYVAGFGLEEEAELISESAASCMGTAEKEEDVNGVVNNRIRLHPWYPRLLQAYVDCQKVGASNEVVGILDGILRDHQDNGTKDSSGRVPLGVDTELDDFMETYTEMLVRHRDDLERLFNEANAFLEEAERDLSTLCNHPYPPLPAAATSSLRCLSSAVPTGKRLLLLIFTLHVLLMS